MTSRQTATPARSISPFPAAGPARRPGSLIPNPVDPQTGRRQPEPGPEGTRTLDLSDTLQVLLVEDNPGDADLVRITLEVEAAVQVRHVPTLGEALVGLQEAAPDVLLLDLALPDAVGFEGLERLQAASPSTPVVVLTGLDDEEAVKEALHLGAEDYVSKHHLEPRLLARALRHAIERHRFRRQIEEVTRELRSANERLATLAETDPLTGLPNRRGLQRVLDAISRRTPGQADQALFIDLDDFKRINEHLGHAVGDLVLKEVGRRFRSVVDASDLVARIGGDEFLIVLPSTPYQAARNVAERVRLVLSGQPLLLADPPVRLTASVGIGEVAGDAATVDEILGALRAKLASAKLGGKNRVSVQRPADVDPRIAVIAALHNRARVCAVRQSIRRLDDEYVVGWEFLSRLDTPVLGTPVDFFRISSEANILGFTDGQCLSACIEAARSTVPEQRRHLNLLPSTVLGLTATKLLERLAPDAGRFCLEISERHLVGDLADLVEPVRALRTAGVQIAIDNIGFGNGGLESLLLLDPEFLKLDRRRVRRLTDSADERAFLVRLLAVARSLGAQVIAEGIETREGLGILRDLGVPLGQGFLWGRPS